MDSKTKKITTTAMLYAVAYVVVTVGRIPVVLFLKYDPKDIIITLGGLIWGPMTSLIVSVIVCITNIGTRLTVDNDREISVETHILNSNEEIYGKSIKIQLFGIGQTISRLYSDPDISYTKEQIYEAVWHEPSNSCCHAVENTIFQIRKRLRDYSAGHDFIKPVIGFVYKFNAG